jgi:hypothetical protein
MRTRIRPHRRIQFNPRLLKNPLTRPRRGAMVELVPDDALPEFGAWIGGGS